MTGDQSGLGARTMLVAFRARNVRSFWDEFELSFEATAMSEPGVPRTLQWREGRSTPMRVLPVAAAFGANAAGKTNLLRAMDDMRRLVWTSFQPRRVPSRRIARVPFRLNSHGKAAPSLYEIDVILNGIRHQYGFEVTDTEVVSEWAYRYPKGRTATIFRRDGDELYLPDDRSKRARTAREFVPKNALFLSVADMLEISELEPLNDWFRHNLLLCESASRPARWAYAARLLDAPERRDQVLEMLRVADLGIIGVRTEEPDPELIASLGRRLAELGPAVEDDRLTEFELYLDNIKLTHRGDGSEVEFDSTEESGGTLVWLGMIGPILDALAHGSVLLADELESSLHPALVAQLVKVFQSQESNPNGAQLIFNSHEARLLGNSVDDRIIGRDQAWFVEKLPNGGSHLYPLSDLGPRKAEAVDRRYIEGRYGAVPIVSSHEFAAMARRAAGAE